jgi:hypothetical protein
LPAKSKPLAQREPWPEWAPGSSVLSERQPASPARMLPARQPPARSVLSAPQQPEQVERRPVQRPAASSPEQAASERASRSN